MAKQQAKRQEEETIEKKSPTNVPAVIAAAGLPATMVSDLEADSGQGFEEADKDAFLVPIIKVLQKMSPEVDETDPAFVEGAKPGMFFNAATKEIYGYKMDIVAVHYQRRYNRWKDRDAGGGFLGAFELDDPVVRTARRHPDKPTLIPLGEDGHPIEDQGLVDTRNHFVIVRKASGYDMAVLPLKSTHLKRSRQWMTQMKTLKMQRPDGTKFTPPMFGFTWQVGPCAVEKNEKGSWHSPVFQNPRPLDSEEIYSAAKGFREVVMSGKAEIQQVEDDDLGGVGGPTDPVDDSDI